MVYLFNHWIGMKTETMLEYCLWIDNSSNIYQGNTAIKPPTAYDTGYTFASVREKMTGP